ncbi:MAG: hypothetical protein ACKVH8_22110 [Pirellulales bacterium]|jgi:hypothetical protein
MKYVHFCLAAVAVTALMFTGCGGGGTNKVTGTVKFSDGSPLTSGTVSFNSDGFSTFGDIQSDGTCEVGALDGGVPNGTYIATVTANSDTANSETADADAEAAYGASLVADNETSVTISSSSKTFSITVDKAGAVPETEPEPAE